MEKIYFVCYNKYNLKKGANMKLSLIIPCYNEEECVESFFSTAKQVFSEQEYETEYIFVNDGSEDNTLSLLKKIYLDESGVNLISFSRNFGKEAAMYAGLKAAKGDYICFIDADLQQRPELAAKMVELLEKHREYDCIAACAKSRKDESGFANFCKKSFYKLISSVSGMEFVDGASDFRCFRRNMADAVLSLSEYHRFSKGLFAWVGFNTRYVPYEIQERAGGESKWSLFSLFGYAFDGMIAFSEKPLRWPLYIGLVTTVFGVIYMLFYLIFNLVREQSFSVAAILICLMFVFFGITLTAIGVLGEYVGKIHVQVKNRPVFIQSEEYLSADRVKNVPLIRRQLENEEKEIKRLKIKRAKYKEMKRRQKVREQIEAQKQTEQEEGPEMVDEEKKPKKTKAKKKKLKEQKAEEEEIYTSGPESGFDDE